MTKPTPLGKIANRAAAYFAPLGDTVTLEQIRDWCDLYTAGDLDTVQLDILTDIVRNRLKPPANS